jgi:hypothetical protein
MQPSDPQAVFRKAVLDLADEPTPVNVRRYMAASLVLTVARTGAPPVAVRRRRPAREMNS